jgi:hypothetical protein
VASLLPVGLHLLAGSPKIGKSWLALWLCNQVSAGEKVWEFDSQKCGTLYISLEDTIDRLHLRLSRIADSGSKDTLFATTADNLATGLIEQLEGFVKTYPDTGLIVIDTFQRIRDCENESTYANDYREVAKIKALADRHKIAVLLIHHLRKAPDSDPFNMVSGSTGIIGAVDSIYVLEKAKRTENAAMLHVTGRDIEDMQIKLEFDRDPPVWRFTGYGNSNQKGTDPVIPQISGFMNDRNEYKGTATELYTALCSGSDGKADSKENGITANNLSRKLKEHALTLEKSHSIKVSFERKNSARLIALSKVTSDTDFTTPIPSQVGIDDFITADVVTTAENAAATASTNDAPPPADVKPPVTDDGNITTPLPSPMQSAPQGQQSQKNQHNQHNKRDGNHQKGNRKKHRHPSQNHNKASNGKDSSRDGNPSRDSKQP